MVEADAEQRRLEENKCREKNWQRWGTYLPERQWGTVRENDSGSSDSWGAFPYEMAQYRAYRWGEDGLLGWTDRECRLCFSTSLWNGKDSVLKERLFGLTNPEGNHGEDVKELFYYLDATPTHSYAKALYKYPQAAFPYEDLRAENKRRGFQDLEYELLDTGVFDQERYFDVHVEYAKADVEDTLIRLSVSNRGPESADLAILPTLTLRNEWSRPGLAATEKKRPSLQHKGGWQVEAHHDTLGTFRFAACDGEGATVPERVLFTENESNRSRLEPAFTGRPTPSKDAFHRFLVHGENQAVKEDGQGTKCAFLYQLSLAPGETRSIYLRLARIDGTAGESISVPFDTAFADRIISERVQEADEFYQKRIPATVSDEERSICRQAYAGLLWCKQFYCFVAEEWIQGDGTQASQNPERTSKYEAWRHLFCRDVLSMPDKWEYPWFAAWDMAFHMIPMGTIDPEFAKAQLTLLLREWYMHPDGQMPAYEYSFGDVNPPVHAWAVWHVYRMGADIHGVGDLEFLERTFQKLLLNFTWWVNRNDLQGRNLFGGGFLGLDNIGVFDRSEELTKDSELRQADATAWMGLYCSCMLEIALELAHHRSPAYEDIASKFFDHYIAVIHAMNTFGGSGLWDEEEGFYFDQLTAPDKPTLSLKVRTIVGIVPLFAVCLLKRDTVAGLEQFEKRLQWFLEHKPELATYLSETRTHTDETKAWRFIALTPKDRAERILVRLLDETEFLSSYGVRALSRAHLRDPFEVHLAGKDFTVRYVPAEGDSAMFGGNSNWRGPIWFPINMLLVHALERYHLVLGDEHKIECPTGSGHMLTLMEVAEELSRRLIRLFLPNEGGSRPSHGGEPRYATDPYWKDLILFSEYFSGDDGRGAGASHQTGWTALVATLIQALHRHPEERIR